MPKALLLRHAHFLEDLTKDFQVPVVGSYLSVPWLITKRKNEIIYYLERLEGCDGRYAIGKIVQLIV